MFGKRKKPVPSIEEAMKSTGLSRDELERRFIEHLIQQGKNPFKDLPQELHQECEQKYPDLLKLCREKFGTDF